MSDVETRERSFPLSAAVLFGLGLGGFFDGIILHQVLQWHHMVSSAGYPPESVENLRFNVFWDGVFHLATYAFTLAGLTILWRHARRSHLTWPGRVLPGGMLVGFGLFNFVEGAVNHQLLGLHHVNETAPPEQWLAWDLAFLASGVILLIAGVLIVHSAGVSGRRDGRARPGGP
jgi:uncharacterized membrane protein